MLKSATPYLIYFVLSLFVILFSQYAHAGATWIVVFYQAVNHGIAIFFNQSPTGLAAQHVISLVVSPLILTGIPALIYYLIKRKTMPYFMEATWTLWTLIVLSNLLIRN